MGAVVKVLGQVAPSANAWTDLYTVPAGASAVCSTLLCANRGAGALLFDVAVRPAGVALANEHIVYSGVQLQTGDSFAATVGFTLSAADVVSVRATTADSSWSLFGEEAS